MPPAHAKALSELVSLPGNSICADCKKNRSSWASLRFCALLCTDCARVHGSLGENVSLIRPLEASSFSAEDIENIRTKGNTWVNSHYEANLPPEYSKGPLQPSIMPKFIHSKYIEKAFTSEEDPLIEIDPREASLPTRLSDYFLIVGIPKFDEVASVKKHEDGRIEVTYKPSILDKYPREEYKDALLPPNIPMFAYPSGCLVTPIESAPICFNFVLTEATGVKLYCTSFQFYEKVSPLDAIQMFRALPELKHELASHSYESALGSYYASKSILIVSHFPFFNVFKDWLCQLYRISRSTSPIPIERFVVNFTREVPLPPRGRIQVHATIADRVLMISRPPKNELPSVDFHFEHLFECLDPESIIKLFVCMLTEQKVVFISSQYSLLANCMEAMCALLFPFNWQGVYIPVLPKVLIDFLYAPVPFLAGIFAEDLVDMGVPDGVVSCNLDTSEVDIPADITIPPLPERAVQKLKDKIKKFANIFVGTEPEMRKTYLSTDEAFPTGEHLKPVTTFASMGGLTVANINAQANGHNVLVPASATSTGARNSRSKKSSGDLFNLKEVRSAFLRFMVYVLSRYPNYTLKDAGAGSGVRFNKEQFLANAPEGCRALLAQIMDSQMFERFIEERIQSLADPFPEVRFFDESIKAKINRSKWAVRKQDTPFLASNEDAIKETFVAPPPNTLGLDPNINYRYDYFPRFKADLFGPVRTVKPLVQRERTINKSSAASAVLMVTLSRRTWQDTMKSIVKLQAMWRGVKERRKYMKIRSRVILIQKWWRSYILLCKERFAFHEARVASISVQRFWRGYYHRNRFQQQKRSARKIQNKFRTHIAKVKYDAVRVGLIRLQAYFRMRRFRQQFLLYRRKATIISSHIRGMICRKRQKEWMGQIVKSIHQEILVNWDKCSVGLAYRSKFYTLFWDVSYCNLAVCKQEHGRLHAMLSAISDSSNKKNAAIMKERLKKMETMLREERKNLYMLLVKATSQQRSSLYEKWQVSEKEKKKKRNLAQRVWTVGESPQLSTDTILSLDSNVTVKETRADNMDMKKDQWIKADLLATVQATMKSLQEVVSKYQSEKRTVERLSKELEDTRRHAAEMQIKLKHIGEQGKSHSQRLFVFDRDRAEAFSQKSSKSPSRA
eukprot:GILJ01009697.1.p1 GENE.GILJ01009697.1~~GILJ01009697.1.p1  ORF type:complete len:1130 (-),score=163.99 GILJ01009697.1:140-3529(-)